MWLSIWRPRNRLVRNDVHGARIHMNSVRVALAFVGAALFALAVAMPVSATTVTVPANDYYVVEPGQFYGGGPILQGSDLSFTWSSDRALRLVVSGPSGVVEYYSSSTHGSDTIEVDETGTYFMTWTNSGSVAAILTYDYDVDMFAPVEHTLDTIVLGIAIAAIVIVVIIVLVVVLVIKGDHGGKPAQAPQHAQPVSSLPPNATNCPTCGAAIDGTNQWCARCGARLR